MKGRDTMHRLFWPVITYRDNDGSARKFSTANACHNLSEARAVIRSWTQTFHILTAKVDVYDASTFPLRKIRTYNFF